MAFPFYKERQGTLLKWVGHIRRPFHKEVFKNNDVGPVTNWGVVERPLKWVRRINNNLR